MDKKHYIGVFFLYYYIFFKCSTKSKYYQYNQNKIIFSMCLMQPIHDVHYVHEFHKIKRNFIFKYHSSVMDYKKKKPKPVQHITIQTTNINKKEKNTTKQQTKKQKKQHLTIKISNIHICMDIPIFLQYKMENIYFILLL